MKLLLCTECSDVFKLSRELRRCSCGRVMGRYLEDGRRAVVNGEGVSMGINNHSLLSAIHAGVEGVTEVLCYVRPHEGKSNPNTTVNGQLLQQEKEPQI